MSSLNRRSDAVDPLDTFYLYCAGALVFLAGIGVASWAGGHWLAGRSMRGWGRSAFAGQAPWLPESTTVLLVIVGGLFLIFGIPSIVRRFSVSRKRMSKDRSSEPIDRAAPYLSPDRALLDLTRKGRAKQAKRIKLEHFPLPMMAETLKGQELMMGLEQTTTAIAGPRSRKTTSFVIPMVVEHTGPVLSTTNKPDVYQLTNAYRARNGDRVWLMDPQRLAGERARIYWDPTEYVRGKDDRCDLRAQVLAGLWTFSSGQEKKDYFDKSGVSLLSLLLLAAALDGQDVLQVRRWVTHENDRTPGNILKKHGYLDAGDELLALVDLPERQRAGVYGTARTATSFLTLRSVQEWVTPGPGRVAFDPHKFVASKDTLYLLSQEGNGSMAPLVTAMTVAVEEAATELATAQGGRLKVPLMMVLDEVANVCPWPDLPAKYSHFGSKGILVASFFQSWSQGAAVFGDAGMKAMWSHTMTAILGAGVTEHGFQSSTKERIGSYLRASKSHSRSSKGGSSSVQGTKDDIVEVSDLSSFGPTRAIIFNTGKRAVIARTVPWFERPYAKAITEAKEKAEQGAPRTGPVVGDGTARVYQRPTVPSRPTAVDNSVDTAPVPTVSRWATRHE